MLLRHVINGKKKFLSLVDEAVNHAVHEEKLRAENYSETKKLNVINAKRRTVGAEIEKAKRTKIHEWEGAHTLTWEGLEANKFGFRAEDCTLDPDAPPLRKKGEPAYADTPEQKLDKVKIHGPQQNNPIGCRHHVMFGTCQLCAEEQAARDRALHWQSKDAKRSTDSEGPKSRVRIGKPGRQRSLEQVLAEGNQMITTVSSDQRDDEERAEVIE
jgi:hypothetical protein